MVFWGVIPPVKTDAFPAATPDQAVPAFEVSAVLHFLLGAIVLGFVKWRGNRAGKVSLVVVGMVGLLLGLILLDAASAYAGHGVGMRMATVLLFTCIGADVAAMALVLIAAFSARPDPGCSERPTL